MDTFDCVLVFLFLNDVSYLLLDKIEIELMQISTLTKTISSIENMVQLEGKHQQLLIQLHKLSAEITTFSNQYQSTINQNKESQKELKQLRKKLKKVTTKLDRREEEFQQLKRQLTSTKDVYEHKLQKLLKKSQQWCHQGAAQPQKKRQRRCSRSKRGREVQCQILEQSIVKELQQRNISLLKKINQLEKELEEQKNESNSKQLYIESLITALETHVEKQVENQQEDTENLSGGSRSNCSDFNDNSTIADSLRDQDREYFVEHQKGEILNTEASQTSSSCIWMSHVEDMFKSVKRLFWKE